MKIKKPDPSAIRNYAGFNIWFDEYVKPLNRMIEEGVEVYSNHGSKNNDYVWTCSKWNKFDTHKALLINIQRIKKETAEDVLRDLANHHPGDETEYVDIKRRAKAVLGE